MTERLKFPASHVPGFYCVFDRGIQRPGFVTIGPTPRRQYQYWVNEKLVARIDGYEQLVQSVCTYIDAYPWHQS